MVKAGNGGLQLLIENTAVCNNDYAVKNCIVVFVVEAGHTVSRPSDRVRFAGTGTVLDEIVMSSAISSNMIDQLTHDIQLVIPWEMTLLLTVFFVEPSGKVSFFLFFGS